jgi:hypothetical protein
MNFQPPLMLYESAGSNFVLCSFPGPLSQSWNFWPLGMVVPSSEAAAINCF